MSVIYIDDRFVPGHEALVSVYDRSFLFGEGLFETFRSFDGQIPFLNDHLNRLKWSSTFLGLPPAPILDYPAILQDLLKKNGLENARFKIHLSRVGQSASPTLNEPGQCRLVIFCEAYDVDLIPPVYKIKEIQSLHNDGLPLASMKTTNFLVKLFALNEAKDSGFDDGLLVNTKGNVTETCTANIFWVDRDGQLWTVLDEQGLLPGVTKSNLLKLLEENQINVRQGVITAKELSHSREIMLTNSIIGIRPVVSVDDRSISGGETGSITAMIRDLCEKQLTDLLN